MSEEEKKATINAKIGLIGDAHTGKTTLMVKYVESRFVEDSIQTVGVSFMEKVVPLGAGKAINFAIWDLGGSAEFLHLLPLLCNDAIVLLFVFDLTRKATLASVREWYKNARKHNKTAIPVLVGTKYDLFAEMSSDKKAEISKTATKYASIMKAPLVFVSAKESINVNKLFKLIVGKIFDTDVGVEEILGDGEPLIKYSFSGKEEAD